MRSSVDMYREGTRARSSIVGKKISRLRTRVYIGGVDIQVYSPEDFQVYVETGEDLSSQSATGCYLCLATKRECRATGIDRVFVWRSTREHSVWRVLYARSLQQREHVYFSSRDALAEIWLLSEGKEKKNKLTRFTPSQEFCLCVCRSVIVSISRDSHIHTSIYTIYMRMY